YRIRATAGGTGLAQGFLGPVPAGYYWEVQRYTTFNPRANSVCELFVLNAEQLPSGMTAAVGDRSGRQDVSITANNAAADNAAPIVVNEGQFLIAFWSGLTAADEAQLSTQIAVYQKLPRTQEGWQQAELLREIPDELHVPDPLGTAFTTFPGQDTSGLALP